MKYTDSYDLIEAYLQGELEGKEKIDFENELKNNDTLKEDYHYHQLANDLLINERLKDLGKTIKNRKSPLKNTWKVLSGLVALILLGSGIFYFTQTEEKSSIEEQAFLQHEESTALEQESIRERVQEEQEIVVSEKMVSPIQKTKTEGETLISDKESGSLIEPSLNEQILSNEQGLNAPRIESLVKEGEDTLLGEEIKGDDGLVDVVPPMPVISPSPVGDQGEPSVEDVIVDSSELEEETNESENESYSRNKKVYLEISPLYEEYDEFQFNEDDNTGILYIYSKQGILVKELEIRNGYPTYWDGKDNNGIIKAGYYVYKFETSSNKLFTGGITVVY